ncbi:hypothetical protein C1H46_014455, partial [Malus baccata]
ILGRITAIQHLDPKQVNQRIEPRCVVTQNVRYKLNLVLEDETSEMNALIIGKSGEKLFGTTYRDLVLNPRLVDQHQLPNEFLRLIGQKKIFDLWFGTRKNMLNMNNILIYNVSEDSIMEPATPQSLLKDITVS